MYRSKNHPNVQLQERDLALLRSLFESRVMTVAHISVLHFGGRAEMAKKRLQRLRSANLVRQRLKKQFHTGMLFLARQGLDVLRQRGILRDYPTLDMPRLERRSSVSESTLQHELDVMNVKTAIHHASLSANLRLLEFTTWPLLNQFVGLDANGRKVTVKPDGFFRITQEEVEKSWEHSFFVELDRSTESQEKLISRAALYVEHYRSAWFAVKNGSGHWEHRKSPSLALYILKSAERRNNTAERLLKSRPPILTQIWLTTFDEITQDPFGAIWMRPVDYRDALAGSQFDTSRSHPQAGYKRQTPRDAFVESTVSRQTLLSSDRTNGH